jgi:hypothetical protein
VALDRPQLLIRSDRDARIDYARAVAGATALLRLGNSPWWLLAEPSGWAILRVVGGRIPETVREWSGLTTLRHALAVLRGAPAERGVPKDAIESLADLVVATTYGEDELADLPDPPGPDGGADPGEALPPAP